MFCYIILKIKTFDVRNSIQETCDGISVCLLHVFDGLTCLVARL